jgi:endonuclease G
MKTLLFALLLTVATVAQAWEQTAPLAVDHCRAHNPYGWAQTSKNVTAICRRAYFVAYDAAAKIPNYVTYTLTPPNALGCVARTNAFAADASVLNGARPDDYAGTGYDKGHMSPDGDLSWDQQVEYESFLMTNMSPQAGSLNRGIWKLLETSIRGWTVQLNNSFTIVSGSIYSPGDKTIGKGVVVPHGFYKIIINNQTGQVAGWRFPHLAPYPNLGNDLTKFRTSIAQIEQEAGVKFAFPSGAREIQSGQEWPIDFAKLTQAKRQKCGASASTD